MLETMMLLTCVVRDLSGHPLLAYIDPGTGSFLFQIIAAALLGVGAAFRSVRMAVADFFGRLLGRRPKK